MEERDGLMALLIAVGDEIYDRGGDPALGNLVEQLLDDACYHPSPPPPLVHRWTLRSHGR